MFHVKREPRQRAQKVRIIMARTTQKNQNTVATQTAQATAQQQTQAAQTAHERAAARIAEARKAGKDKAEADKQKKQKEGKKAGYDAVAKRFRFVVPSGSIERKDGKTVISVSGNLRECKIPKRIKADQSVNFWQLIQAKVLDFAEQDALSVITSLTAKAENRDSGENSEKELEQIQLATQKVEYCQKVRESLKLPHADAVNDPLATACACWMLNKPLPVETARAKVALISVGNLFNTTLDTMMQKHECKWNEEEQMRIVGAKKTIIDVFDAYGIGNSTIWYDEFKLSVSDRDLREWNSLRYSNRNRDSFKLVDTWADPKNRNLEIDFARWYVGKCGLKEG